MAVEEARAEVVVFTEVGVCPTAGRAPRLESFYETRRLSAELPYTRHSG